MEDYEPNFEYEAPPPKNNFFIGRSGLEIEVQITASSEEMAIAIYKSMERLLIEGARVDFEEEWD